MRLTAYLVLAAVIIVGLWACSEDQQIPPAAPEPPLEFIDSIIPVDGARNVALSSAIQVTFLRPMDTASLTADKFYLNGGDGYAFTRNSLRATLYPFGNLRPDYPYEAIVRAGVRDRDGNIMPSDYAWTFRTGFGTSIIDDIYPPSGAEYVPVDASIFVVFDHRMDETTIDESSFTVLGITGQVSYGNDTAWFVPDPELAYDQEYTAVLSPTIADTAGVELGQSFSWSFTTTPDDSVPPEVVSVFPADGAVDVSLDTEIRISFSEDVNPSLQYNWSLIVSDGVTGLVELVAQDIIFQPNTQLEYAHTYTATFSGTIYDYFGNALDTTVTWSFTTRPVFSIIDVIPADGSVGASPHSAIAATFSHAVNPASVNDSTLTVYSISDSRTLTGSVICNDTMLIFAPDQSLKIGRHIQATVKAGVSSTLGESLAEDYNWTFIVEPGELMPLAVGNKWVYEVNGTGLDSIMIDGDTLINDTLWFLDKNGLRYQNFPNKFMTTNSHLPPSMVWSIDYPGQPWAFRTVTVPAGDFSAIRIYIDDGSHRYEYYYAPDVGRLSYTQWVYAFWGRWDLVASYKLLRMELQEP